MNGAVAESPFSAIPSLPGLAVETVEWLPSGAESGLVRVRGRWIDEAARQGELPVLALRAGGVEHRFDSLPDARFSRDPASWRGTYLVPAALVAAEPEALWLEWAGATRSGPPTPARGIEPPPGGGGGGARRGGACPPWRGAWSRRRSPGRPRRPSRRTPAGRSSTAP